MCNGDELQRHGAADESSIGSRHVGTRPLQRSLVIDAQKFSGRACGNFFRLPRVANVGIIFGLVNRRTPQLDSASFGGGDAFVEREIDFMGGKPFMNFPLIKSVVEWLEQGVISVPWICFATTNGTLLTDEIKAWLREHKTSINLGASYDGTSQMQSTNRGTDKYKLDLDFFREVWPHQPLHMTISKETLPTLAEGVLDIQARGYDVEAGLAEGVDWTIEDALIFREQLCILKDAYLKNPALTPFNRLSRFVDVFDLPADEKVQPKWCGTGKYMATYDIDGKKYGCHMFTPVVCGDKALLSDAVEWDSPESTVDNYCKSCVLRSYCSTCPGFNYKYCGHLAVRDKCWCPVILRKR